MNYELTTLGALNMVGLAWKNNARLLQASTSEVYGDLLNHPQKEEDWGNVNPIGIRSFYDDGKRGAESYIMDAWSKWNRDIRIVRIFNTSGPRMNVHDGRVVSNDSTGYSERAAYGAWRRAADQVLLLCIGFD